MTRSRTLKILIPLAVLLGLVTLFAVAGTLSERDDSSEANDGLTVVDKTRSAASAQAALSAGTAEGVDGRTTSMTGAVAIPAASVPSAHYLVRNGYLTLTVSRGSLPRAVDRVTALTTGLGGYVVSSSVGTEPIAWPSGAEPALGEQASGGGTQTVSASGDDYATITVRVPERQFDTALRRYSALGDVQGVSTSSEDVTTQYVDLAARLEHHRAVERRLIRFLAATDTVSQMLAVQDRLDKVQLTIEQLSAELKSLREITSYGTITVSLSEEGRVAAAPAGTSFWDVFWHSMQLLGRGARATALAIVAMLPFLAVAAGVAAGVWLIARRLRRRRRPAQPSLPA
jgi:hypothetical protein